MCFEPRHRSFFFPSLEKYSLPISASSIWLSSPTHITHSRISSIQCSYSWSCSKSSWEISTNWSEGRQQVQQTQLHRTDALNNITVSDFIFLWCKGTERFTHEQLICLSECCCAQAIPLVSDELFSVHNLAGCRAGCSGVDAFIWETWSVYVAWCSVSMPCKNV